MLGSDTKFVNQNKNFNKMGKIFNEKWEGIFNPQKSHNNKVKNYLDSFKKSYDERNKPENILVQCLYCLEFLGSQDSRFLGVSEGVLLMENYIEQGGGFDYKEREGKFLFIPYITRETYREHIIRLTKEYLSEKGIL